MFGRGTSGDSFPAPYAYYRFQGDGTDSSGNGRALTLIGGSYVAGLIGLGSLGKSTGAQLPVSVATGFTLSVWLQSLDSLEYDGTGASVSLLSDFVRYGIQLVATWETSLEVKFDAGVGITELEPIGLSGWEHAAIVWDGSEARFFLNGGLVRTGNIATVPEMIDIQGEGDFPSAYDELGVWDVALSESQVQQLYNGGAGFDPTA